MKTLSDEHYQSLLKVVGAARLISDMVSAEVSPCTIDFGPLRDRLVEFDNIQSDVNEIQAAE